MKLVEELHILKNAFIWNHKFNKMFFVEALFWVFISASFLIYRFIIQTTSAPIEEIQAAGTANVDSLASSMNIFLSSFAVATISLAIIVLMAYCLSRAIVWTDLLDKKLTRKEYLKFVLLKFLWSLLWTPIVAILIIPVFLLSGTAFISPTIFATFQFFVFANIALYILIAYFGLFMYHAFFMQNRLYDSITQAFKHGITEIPKMLISIIILVLGCGLTFLIYTILKMIGLSYWITDLIIIFYIILALRRYMLMKVAVLHIDRA